MDTLNSVEAVISALGGVKAVQELTRRASESAVPNWKLRKSFPSNTYAVMKAALKAKGCTAPDHLWGMEVAQAS